MPASPRIVAPTPEAIAEAGASLRAGGLVVFPTETVYGLGADATNDRAVAAIFRVKSRPRFNPVIAHLAEAEAATELAAFDDRARRLARAFWPGPLSLVLPRRADCPASLLLSAGLDSIAVRVPAHPVARDLLIAAGCPVGAPSANVAGEVSPTRAEHAASSLGTAVDMVLDAGPCRIGLESTVLELTGSTPVLLRPGGATREALEAEIGPVALSDAAGRPRGPGMLRSHYAPRLPVRLEATGVDADEALLAFGPGAPEGAAETLNLSPAGDLTEAAANLFAMLRALDRPGRAAIAVVPVPEHGLGLAINDRLRRAAAPRAAPTDA